MHDPSGTTYYQGGVVLKNKKRPTSLHNKYPWANWETMRKTTNETLKYLQREAKIHEGAETVTLGEPVGMNNYTIKLSSPAPKKRPAPDEPFVKNKLVKRVKPDVLKVDPSPDPHYYKFTVDGHESECHMEPHVVLQLIEQHFTEDSQDSD